MFFFHSAIQRERVKRDEFQFKKVMKKSHHPFLGAVAGSIGAVFALSMTFPLKVRVYSFFDEMRR